MATVVVLLFASYLVVDAFVGFSIVLVIGVLAAVYGLVDPGQERSIEIESEQRVS
jgi:hypothetical protein